MVQSYGEGESKEKHLIKDMKIHICPFYRYD